MRWLSLRAGASIRRLCQPHESRLPSTKIPQTISPRRSVSQTPPWPKSKGSSNQPRPSCPAAFDQGEKGRPPGDECPPPMKVVVTGGAGFIGSHVVEHYQGRADIVVLDNFRTGHRRNLEGLDCQLIEGDVCDVEAVREAVHGADLVIHLAALVSVPESMEQPLQTAQINGLGLLRVLEAARLARARKFVFASSAAVYGEHPAHPKVENQPPDPRSPYAFTKLEGEYWCAHYTRQGWLPTVCLRFFNVFGPRQNPASPYAAAVPIFLGKARRGEPITIFGDGEQTRDFIYVKDIAGALAFCAETENVTGVFNVGYGGSTSILELAREILRLTKSPSSIVFAPERPGDIRHSTADASKLLAAGWAPRYALSSGLEEMLSIKS